MGLAVFVVLAALEIALAVRTYTKRHENSKQREARIFVRVVQLAVVSVALIVPTGQKWRFVPVLCFLTLLLVIAVIVALAKRNIAGKPRKQAGVIASCVACVSALSVLLVPAFVFTGYSGLPTTGEYQVAETSAILVDGSRIDPFEQDGSAREVPVHFYYPAATNGHASEFPLVVFSHGAFGYYQNNTSTYMELASNGYVVVALDHPHHAFFTTDTTGQTVIVNRDFLNTALDISSQDATKLDPQEQLAIYQDWMALRTADMGFVLDELEQAGESAVLDGSWFTADNNDDEILGILGTIDYSKIGLMGHSMGGATSVQLGRERDDVTAVIDLDGTMLGEYTGVSDGKLTVNEEPYTVPVLEFVNWETYNELAKGMEEFRAEGGAYANDELMRNAADGYTVTIRDTEHMDFTDLPLLSPTLGNMLGSGERDSAETMTIVNSVVLDFFDCYLKGQGAFSVQDVY
ncbi:Predicted dienelactone hydrolase [Slackia heliotrinireducens]|uniref:Platelet-activating factor acetylhydrolase, plasma/intracellular isoform II n=1 Tax=Slackia heliotrinireducens (strain ATCC 29202 / DSM 20476 / NCTC 11029 / RHS 1) TaxID=471855 RepID=C7N703_SLAHD|nr:dienelactone hydrolase family protein [Slackia heliotrinireducens]ACV22688.1 Platelet-activating factor acetylhydrolase, plasma/intracellular isoform II [Slackia heliotrinireducens DSM 20476]VEH01282.1 Predicted dienelactone hydrolase [Slackia heliotrinireducens]